MQQASFEKTVNSICKSKSAYKKEAYFFIREALDYTVKNLDKPAPGKRRHVSGIELLEGIKEFSRKEFGPMAITVLRQWGINQTGDFGEIVFALVEAGLLGKTDEDRKEDFYDVYDFHEEFVKPFQPRKKYNCLKKTKSSPVENH